MEMSDEEFEQRTLAAIAPEFGPAYGVRFLGLPFRRDYTAEGHPWLGHLTLLKSGATWKRKALRKKANRLLPRASSCSDLETDDKVASATVIPPEDPKTTAENGTLLQ